MAEILKIASKFALRNIFEYIKDDNFKLKLVVHSKELQKKLDITLFDYIVKYFINNDFEIKNYCSIDDDNDIRFPKILKNKLNKFLLKYHLNISDLQSYLIEYFKKYSKELKDNYKNENKIKVDIFSPILNILLNIDIFEDIFIISVNINRMILNKNLINDYINFFDSLNKKNKNYSLLIKYFSNSYHFDFINTFKIDDNKIKYLVIKSDYHDKIENIGFFPYLFHSKNIENSVIYLDIDLGDNKIEPYLFENINNFKVIENLSLINIHFKTIFIIKLINLKILSLDSCKNITFLENTNYNLKELILRYSEIIKQNTKFKFPQIEVLKISDVNSNIYSLMFDFENMKKIRILKARCIEVNHIGDNLLENIEIEYGPLNSERKVLEKLLTIKTLKEISFEIKYLNNNEIQKIKGKNTSVNNFEIKWNYNVEDSICYNLQNLFPNLKYFCVKSYNDTKGNSKKLEIKENLDCKINEINIDCNGNKNVKLYCGPYEDLKGIQIYLGNFIFDFQNSFPIFNDKRNIVFKSLIYFNLTQQTLKFFDDDQLFKFKFNTLNNIYNNIDNMPNLQEFELNILSIDIDDNFYENFIKKLIEKNLNFIYFSIKRNKNDSKDLYTYDELKLICPKLNKRNFKNYTIIKYKNNKLNYITNYITGIFEDCKYI